MAVDAAGDKIEIRLQAKSGERSDPDEIATCLERSIAKTEK